MGYIPDHLMEQYFILLLEARVKICMTSVELEVPGTYERYLKWDYFYKKSLILEKFTKVNNLATDQMKADAWYRLILEFDALEEMYDPYKPYWTFK